MNLSRILSRCVSGTPRYLKSCAIIIIVIFVIESIIFNTVILYFVYQLGSTVSKIVQAPGATLIDKLAIDPTFKNLVYSGKNGGFKSLIEHTLGRVYFLDGSCDDAFDEKGRHDKLKNIECDYPRIHSVGLDVSGAGEVLYIYGRMQKYTHKPWTRLIIDIGANDGLMSSNSFNFIQWGWDAILVEPQASQLNLATRNLKGFQKRRNQHIDFVQAVLGERDGRVEFKLSHDIVSMESHVMSNHRRVKKDDTIVQVDCYSVTTFARKYAVPKNFGILSIDAEGAGSKILHQWMGLGYRPAYIIYEALHDPEAIQETIQRMGQNGYTFLTALGWNSIFEYDFSRYNTTGHRVRTGGQ